MTKIGWRSKNQISIRTSSILVVFLLLITLSCSYLRRSGTNQKAPSPPVEAKDPIISMVMASSIDAKGKIVNSRFTFPPNEPQMTAIVRVGKIKDSQLNVTWYQTSEDGDKKLFEHQIQVKSNDRAFSVGKNATGTLLAGTYKVVATLEGQTKEMEFDVSPPKTAQKQTSSGFNEKVLENRSLMQKVVWDASSQTAPTTSTGSTAAQGNPPVGGSSGTVPQSATAPATPKGIDCLASPGIYLQDFSSNMVELEASGMCSQPHQMVSVVASINGPPQEVGQFEAGVFDQAGTGEYGSSTFYLDPCWLSGGSDLPGTKITADASVNGITYPFHSLIVTLDDDTLAPRINVVSTPARGTKVKAGDKIKLSVTATEKRSGGPWQTGVKIIQITALEGGLVKEPWTNPSNLPKACNEKTWEQKDEATYTVPNNPPPIITICAVTQDYVGNESSKCGEFYTGPRWTGTMTSHSRYDVNGPGLVCSAVWETTISFVVGDKGVIAGQATAKMTGLGACPHPNQVYPQSYEYTYSITGTATPQQLKLQLSYIAEKPASGVDSTGFAGSIFNGGAPAVVPITSATEGRGTISLRYQTGVNLDTSDNVISLVCKGC